MTKAKLPKIFSLRNIEYYDFQETLDKLYADSEKSKSFTRLMDYIISPQNIMLAYRNLKVTSKNSKSTSQLSLLIPKKKYPHLWAYTPQHYHTILFSFCPFWAQLSYAVRFALYG